MIAYFPTTVALPTFAFSLAGLNATMQGRTHQLRVHAAHPRGLDRPIVGDDIYGERDDRGRLCLHAGYLEVTHPATGKRIAFTSPAPF